MAKVDNSTKGWGNVLKPQGQDDTAVVIQPREMKMDELVAVLDKMSHKGIKPVPYQHGYLSSGFMGRDGVAVSFDKFTYDRDFKTYTAHMEDEGVYVDIRNIGQEGVEVGLMNLKKQQLEKVLGTDNEYKLPHSVVLTDFYGKGTQAVVDSVMLTNEYDDLVLTWQGQYTGTDGKVYKHEFDPDDDNISNNASVITDLCDLTIKDIQQKLNMSQSIASKDIQVSRIDALNAIVSKTESPDGRAFTEAEKAALLTYAEKEGVTSGNARDGLLESLVDSIQFDGADSKAIAATKRQIFNLSHNLPDGVDLTGLRLNYTQDHKGFHFQGDINGKPFSVISTPEEYKAIRTKSSHWTDILTSNSEFRKLVDTATMSQGQASAQAVDAEQALHDNFEELMKEQEKQDRNQGLKL